MNADKKIRVHPPNGRSIVLTRLNLLLYTEGYGASTRLSGYTVNMWGSLTWDVQEWKLE